MGENAFNRRQCVHALLKIGFFLDRKRCGRHDKFKAPFSNANPPFIMIPRHKELHCQDEIIKELKHMGGDELLERFKKLL